MGLYGFENEARKFNGDLKAFLISKGIDENCIESAQDKLLQPGREIYHDYDAGDSGCISLVPLDRVVGLFRGAPGVSVFKNVENPSMGDLEPQRLEDCLSRLDRMSLRDFRKSFEQLSEPVDMEYYDEDDTYFLRGDGNHRTIIAMLVGAERIRARVAKAHCNPDKMQAYFAYEGFLRKSGAKRLEVSSNGVGYGVVFGEGDSEYIVDSYEVRKPSESRLEYMQNLLNQIKEDCTIAEKIEAAPKIIRSLRLWLVNRTNSRVCQFLDKNYIDNHRRRQESIRTEFNPTEY
ncbi:MAG: hypothetical protein J5532_00195 [Lachnospiraceae bacterium]|nr:hypothetical protein [Lachnospiraceae bacterium]